jgi:hypothetical protein
MGLALSAAAVAAAADVVLLVQSQPTSLTSTYKQAPALSTQYPTRTEHSLVLTLYTPHQQAATHCFCHRTLFR